MMQSQEQGGLAEMGIKEKDSAMGDMYFIDRIEDGMATVVIADPESPEGYREEQRSEADLPEGAGEGDTVHPDGRIEKAGESQEGQEMGQRRDKMLQSDPGGDIKL